MTEKTNFVPALPAPHQVDIAEGERDLPAPPAPVLLQTGYEDRARGFSLSTAPLAVSVGLVTALIAIVGWHIPALSVLTLLLALGGFCLTWLFAYLAHVLVSPDGVLFLHVALMWRYLRQEQRERHRRLRRMRNEHQ